MARQSQRYRSTSLPFNYRDRGVEFDLHTYTVDESGSTDLKLKPGQTELDLSSTLSDPEEDSRWETIALNGTLRIPEETIEEVFPPEEHDNPPAKLYIAIRCHDTIYRDRILVSESLTTRTTYDVSVPIQKDEVRGSIELRPYLVRTKDGEADGEYATKRNFRVASGTIYTLVIDRPIGEEPPAIDGEHISFSRASHLPDGEKLYYLDFRNESRPKLWINADHPRITEVLQSQGSVGAEARMRDVILDQISYGVWMQLLIHAGSAMNEDGDTEFEWQQTVLETFAKNMYEVDDVHEATLRLRDDLKEPDQLSHVMQRLDNELQEYIHPRKQLINLMEEGLQI